MCFNVTLLDQQAPEGATLPAAPGSAGGPPPPRRARGGHAGGAHVNPGSRGRPSTSRPCAPPEQPGASGGPGSDRRSGAGPRVRGGVRPGPPAPARAGPGALGPTRFQEQSRAAAPLPAPQVPRVLGSGDPAGLGVTPRQPASASRWLRGGTGPPRGLPRSGRAQRPRPLASGAGTAGPRLHPGPRGDPADTGGRGGRTGAPGTLGLLPRRDPPAEPPARAPRAQPPNRRPPGGPSRPRGGSVGRGSLPHARPRPPGRPARPRGPRRPHAPPHAPRQLAAAACAAAGTPRPAPEVPPPRSPGPGGPGRPRRRGLAGCAALGAGSGGGNVNKSGFYSYLTLECRVHLLSARYQKARLHPRVYSQRPLRQLRRRGPRAGQGATPAAHGGPRRPLRSRTPSARWALRSRRPRATRPCTAAAPLA